MPTSWMDTVLRQSVAALRELVEPRGFVLQCWEGTPWRDVVQFRRIPTL